VQTYEGSDCEIWHADLYRLSAPEEVIELGLTDAFDDSICLVEWPDRLEDLAPAKALSLAFSMQPEQGRRILRLSSTNPRWVPLFKAISHD